MQFVVNTSDNPISFIDYMEMMLEDFLNEKLVHLYYVHLVLCKFLQTIWQLKENYFYIYNIMYWYFYNFREDVSENVNNLTSSENDIDLEINTTLENKFTSVENVDKTTINTESSIDIGLKRSVNNIIII